MYAVYLEDKRVYEGTKVQVANYVGVSRGTLDFLDSGYIGKYWVQRERYTDVPRKKIDETIDYLVLHLTMHGNTVLNINDLPRIEKIREEMKKRNLDFTYRIVTDQFIDKTMKKVPKQFIVLERKK